MIFIRIRCSTLLLVIILLFFVNRTIGLSTAKETWLRNSLSYYERVTRGAEHVKNSPNYFKLAMESYFAKKKIHSNKLHHAERIYRRLIDEMSMDHFEENHAVAVSDFSNLAVPTLLLCLLLQRENRYEDTRCVFDDFLHVLESNRSHRCCCSARVLQAYALFEMKQKSPVRAVELILQAIRMDPKLRPVLQCQVFREAMVLYHEKQRQRMHGNLN